MIIVHPLIDPVIVSLGFIQIRWYGLAYVLGFIIGLYLIKSINRKYSQPLKNKIYPNRPPIITPNIAHIKNSSIIIFLIGCEDLLFNLLIRDNPIKKPNTYAKLYHLIWMKPKDMATGSIKGCTIIILIYINVYYINHGQ